jgi:predicted O-methyltransferase YrrM
MGFGATKIIKCMEFTELKGTQVVLDKIFRTRKVQDIFGNEYSLDSNIDKSEGLFLQKIILENEFKSSIEIGCAYGISSLFICGALIAKESRHTIVDPYQSTDWKNIGVENLKRAGVKNFELKENKSELVLPELLASGATYDFVFIDGWHTFDHTLIDMFYLNKMLNVGGVMVVDDVTMKGVEKAVNYFLNYPAFEFLDGVVAKMSNNRTLFDTVLTKPLKVVANLIPNKVREEIFSNKVLSTGISGYSMVALRKVKEDVRPWNWYKFF